MTVSHVQRNSADPRTLVPYDPTKKPVKMRLNTLKVFDHMPAGLGARP